MNTVQTWQIVSRSAGDTVQIAAAIGAELRGGEIIELISDLGGGKTTFVQGLVAGAGSDDVVASPSFTISRQYRAKQLYIDHYDFYRLDDPGIMAAELQDNMHDPATVTVIEWANIVESILPANRLRIRLQASSDNERRVEFQYTDKLKYLLAKIERIENI